MSRKRSELIALPDEDQMDELLLRFEAGRFETVREPPTLRAREIGQILGKKGGIEAKKTNRVRRPPADQRRRRRDPGSARFARPEDRAGQRLGMLAVLGHRPFRALVREPEPAAYLAIESLQKQRSCLDHPLIDLRFQLGPERVERGIDLGGEPAGLIDVQHALLEVQPGSKGAEDLVGSAEHAFEQPQLRLQYLKEA